MDNTATLGLGTHSSCYITLNQYQYEFYRQSTIEIRAPDGSYLECIGKQVQKDLDENSTHQLCNQIYLIESLLSKITVDVELPSQAIASLSDLLFRTQGFFDRHMK